MNKEDRVNAFAGGNSFKLLSREPEVAPFSCTACGGQGKNGHLIIS